MPIDSIAFFGDSYCADVQNSYIGELAKDYKILHLGSCGLGLSDSVNKLQNFLDNRVNHPANNNNIFYVFCNSSSSRRQFKVPYKEKTGWEYHEEPLTANWQGDGVRDRERIKKAIELYYLYLQNDEEDRRIYKNALLAQRYLIERLSIKSSIRFSCFQKEALWNNADFYWFNDEGKEEKWNNLYDFAYHFDDHTADPKGQLDNFIYPNHFSPKGQKAMEQIIRTAINEYSN